METHLPAEPTSPDFAPDPSLSAAPEETSEVKVSSEAKNPDFSPEPGASSPEPLSPEETRSSFPEDAASSEDPPLASDLEAPAEAAQSAPLSGSEEVPDELARLAAASQKVRLSPAEEERMGVLLKEALLGGRAGVARAIEIMPQLPWIVSVKAVEATWPDLTAGFRTQLLAGLAKDETDAALRVRLSLARALFRLDVPVALKLALGALKEMREKDTGELQPKHAQIIANVFIGRAKPWLAQLSLAEMKPSDGDLVVHCAVLAAFTLPHPPVSQLAVLRWSHEQQRLEKLQENALLAVQKCLERWSAKWQGALRQEITELPEALLSMLRPVAASEASGNEPARATESGEENAENSSSEELSVRDENAPGEERENADDEDPDEDDEEDSDTAQRARPVYEPREQRGRSGPTANASGRDRPVYTPRHAEGSSQGGGAGSRFNLHEALRQIEGHVSSLRNELASTQSKLRQKDDDRRRRPEKTLAPIIPGEPTLEELARLNVQLEARNAELQARILELTQHSEDVAVSTGAMSGEPVIDTGAQLRTLLRLKLKDDFSDFLALEKEANDLVVQQHYRGLIRHVFEVLQQLEVRFDLET